MNEDNVPTTETKVPDITIANEENQLIMKAVEKAWAKDAEEEEAAEEPQGKVKGSWFYEITVKEEGVNTSTLKPYKQSYGLITQCVFFAEAEAKAYEEFAGEKFKDSDVVGIKRSCIREIVNERPTYEEGEPTAYKATLIDRYITDSGAEKFLKYHVLVWAKDLADAKTAMDTYIKAGMGDMTLDSLQSTKIIDVI